MKRKYHQEYDIAPAITFDDDCVALDIPDTGANTDNGWAIEPAHKAHVSSKGSESWKYSASGFKIISCQCHFVMVWE